MRILLGIILLPILFLQSTFAYTVSEVEKHTIPSDCWVVFENKVYDLSEYLPSHDMYLDIRDWCGDDMTKDFKDKAGEGRDHRVSSYSLLERYYIGDIDEVVLQNTEDSKQDSKLPYNIVVPLLLSVLGYWVPYMLIKKGIFKKSIKTFNAFWNTVLIFLLLVPAFGFGVIMILRYRFPSIWDLSFDFMYWHVELSLVMGILGINHFIQRLKIYFSQLKK